jgi:hypothetical protein
MQARPGWLARRWPKSARGEPLAASILSCLALSGHCKASNPGRPRSPGPAALTRRSAGHQA